ncbi:thiamine-phosphate diphosphorylase [Paenibacillus sp. FSL H7-0326]|uniref:thiamine phosphate synthase n=1 Tax=Paenibacillus sp. FSL H7-0326 TaxID=1921144 RepID=UPI00096BFE36|nr:thiamine phosphate synthase [Paenibacillus sp. FSL H7-0326]OMC69171.1 thiamine-phosphate diphosphorylase [Paenibacillus sp. FSL H7-0326]
MSRISSVRMKELLRVYFVMGSRNCVQAPEDTLQAALTGGLTLFQFREKGPGCLEGAERIELARRLQKLCREHKVPFIVNDDVDLALEVDADGVHVGQEDEEADLVRQRIGDRILGISAHTIQEAARAYAQGADYIGVGPIYPTKSKDDAQAVQGPEIITAMRNANITLPIVGIGGITADNAKDVFAAGADGIAVISAISYAEDIAGRVRQLQHNFKA